MQKVGAEHTEADLPTTSLYARRYLLCSDHFEENVFLCPAGRNRLVWNAVQTLFSVLTPLCPHNFRNEVRGRGRGMGVYIGVSLSVSFSACVSIFQEIGTDLSEFVPHYTW